jgi:hypothetical protein
MAGAPSRPARTILVGGLSLLLAAWSSAASAGTLLWNGITAGSTSQEVGALLLVDERGTFHSFDRTYRIAQFYLHADEAVRVAVLFDRHDGLVNEVDLLDGNQPNRAEQALDQQYGRPLSSRIEARRPTAGQPTPPNTDTVRIMTWKTGDVRVVLEQPVNRASYVLRFCSPTART